MNEIKRQLNQKMGDTSNRTTSVIQKIEAQKKMKRTPKKSKSSGPIYIALASLLTVLALFFLMGPWSKEEPSTSTNPETNLENPVVNTPEETSYKELLRKYFKQDGDFAYFHGKGHESASLNEKTIWLSDDYVQVMIDNGGSLTQNIYRITDTSIELLINEYADEDYQTPSMEELQQLQAVETILQAPFEDGKVFAGKTMYTNVQIKTLYGTFNSIMTEDNENPIQRYYVEGLGLVFEKYGLEDDYVIEHNLASINEVYNIAAKQMITVYNETTKMDESLLVLNFDGFGYIEYMDNPEQFNVTYRMLKKVANGELGVFMYKCNEREQCTYEFVHKTGETFTTLQTYHFVSYGNVTFSIDEKYAAIPIYSSETKLTSHSSSTIEVPKLLLINLQKMEEYIPVEVKSYMGYYPIVSHKWLNEKTLSIQVADIPNDDHETIYAWQNGEQKTKELIINLP